MRGRMQSDKIFDVIVIGGGIVGVSIAYYARQHGQKVLLLERGEPGREASGRHGGGIRQQKRSESDYQLAVESLHLWHELTRTTGANIEFEECGNIQFALTEEELASLCVGAETDRSRGLPVELLSAEQVRRLEPEVSEKVIGAAYCKSDAQANPMLAMQFMYRLALSIGVEAIHHCEVQGIESANRDTVTVKSSGGTFRAASAVLAVGPWVNPLLAPLGVQLPVYPRRTQSCITTATRQVLRQWIRGNTVWIRQTHRGNVQIGGAGAWEPLSFDKSTRASTIGRYARRAAELVPALGRLGILRSWAGTLDMTPDRAPIIDHAPGFENIHFAVGFAGHGFGTAPAVGQLVADRIIGKRSLLDNSLLRLARFPSGLNPLSDYTFEREPV